MADGFCACIACPTHAPEVCGVKLLRPISIRNNECQACRNYRQGAGRAK